MDYITRIRTQTGDKQIDYNSLANLPKIKDINTDTTFTKIGVPADAKAVGDALTNKIDKIQSTDDTGKVFMVSDTGEVLLSTIEHSETIFSAEYNKDTQVIRLIEKKALEDHAHIDSSLTISGDAADAKITGDKIKSLESNDESILSSISSINSLVEQNKNKISANESTISSNTENITSINSDISEIKLLYPDLSEKVIYCLGDSIAQASGSWPMQMAQLTNAKKVYNLGRNKATWSDRSDMIIYDSNCAIWNNEFGYLTSTDGKTEYYPSGSATTYNVPPGGSVYATISNEIRFMTRLITEYNRPEPNIIVIFAGINDTTSSTTEYTDSAFDTIINMSITSLTFSQLQTIQGGLHWCIGTLATTYPDAEIFVCTPIQSPNSDKKPYLQRTRSWITKMGEYYNAKVIELYSECGISSAFETAGGSGRYLSDGIHPNDDGKILTGKYIAKQVLLRNNR